MCIYWRQKTAHPTWQAIGTPKSNSLPEFHLHATALGLNRGPFCGPRDPEGVYTSEWPSPCTQPLPTYCLKHAKKGQHNLKLCTNNATLFCRYIACQKSQHTLKLCKNDFEGTSHAQKSVRPSSCVRTMHQLVQALPTPQTPTVLWTDVSKPAGTSLEDSTLAMGPYCTQYKSTHYSFLPWLSNWGTSWWCPNTKNLCLVIDALTI